MRRINGINVPVDSNYCDQYDGAKPGTVQPCNVGLECPLWYTDPWKPVSKNAISTFIINIYRIQTVLVSHTA